MAVQSFEICGHFGEPDTKRIEEKDENTLLQFSFGHPDEKERKQKFSFTISVPINKGGLLEISHEWLFRTHPQPLASVNKEDMGFAPGLFASMINLSGEMVRNKSLADGHRLELSYPNILKLVTEMLEERLPHPSKA